MTELIRRSEHPWGHFRIMAVQECRHGYTHIPFAFVAGGVTLPAGEYRVYHPGNPYVIVIEKNGRTMVRRVP